jgi:hypothetical protein
MALPFLIWALDGGEWSALRLGRFTPSKKDSLMHVVLEAGWAPELVWRNLLPMLGIEPRLSSP